MPTLYGAPISPFVRKVMVALAEKGIAYCTSRTPVTLGLWQPYARNPVEQSAFKNGWLMRKNALSAQSAKERKGVA